MTIERAITAPTERSMPAVRMTTNWPRASIAMTEDWRATLLRLSCVRKYCGDRMARITINRISARPMPKRSSTAERVSLRGSVSGVVVAVAGIRLPPSCPGAPTPGPR